MKLNICAQVNFPGESKEHPLINVIHATSDLGKSELN